MAEDQIQLRDSDVFPSDKVIEDNLGKNVYHIYQELLSEVDKMELAAEWRYYKDGKAWLCKVVNKKKTVFWLSVWDGYFKTSFFFTAKNCLAIENLDIDRRIKEEFAQVKATGKLLPLILDIRKKEHLSDLLKIVECKKSLK